MNLSAIIREISELAIPGEKYQSNVKGWCNRAQRAICQRYNWNFMRNLIDVTIVAGSHSANLPALWKELCPEKSPITFTAPGAFFPTPVNVKTRAELNRTGPWPFPFGYIGGTSGYWTPFYVFIEQDAGALWTINSPAQYPQAANATYSISCFLFPDELVEGTDTSGVTDDAELCEALIEWVKSKAYAAVDPTDPRAAASMQLYNEHVTLAMGQAARQRLAGQSLHM